jgi:hypothetical protein
LTGGLKWAILWRRHIAKIEIERDGVDFRLDLLWEEKTMRTISKASLALFVLLLVAACGAQPIAVDQVPVYPGAQPMERGQNTLADSVADAMRQSAGEQSLNAQFRFFALPGGTTWDNVKSFYSDELTKAGWSPESAMDIQGGAFQAVGWSRGSGNNQQALMVAYVSDVTGEGAFAIAGLFSK